MTPGPVSPVEAAARKIDAMVADLERRRRNGHSWDDIKTRAERLKQLAQNLRRELEPGA